MAWDAYCYWPQVDRKKLKRSNELIRDAMRSPSDGLGSQNRYDLT